MSRVLSNTRRPSQFRLLQSARLAPLWLCQVCDTLAYECLRLGMLLTLGAQMVYWDSASQRAAVFASFVIPALVGAPLGGQLADRYDRHKVVRLTQGLLLLTAATGVWALAIGSPQLLLVALALSGFHASLFTTARNAVVRQQLDEDEFVAGLALLTTGRYLGMLAGTFLAVAAAGAAAQVMQMVPWILMTAGLAAVIAAYRVPASPVTPGDFRIAWSPVEAIRNTLMVVLHDRDLFLAVLGVSWFWLTVLVYLVYLPDFANQMLGIPIQHTAGLLAVPVIGTIVGALACYPASGRRIELGLVPLGSIGMAVAGIIFYVSAPDAAISAGSTWTEWLREPDFRRVMLGLFLFGASAALFVTPLRALIIALTPEEKIGRVVGGMLLYSLIFVSGALIVVEWLHSEGLSVEALALTVTLMHAGVSVYIFLLLPEFLLRLIMWVLIHLVYRVDANGLEHVPAKGPAVIVCNHITYMDALVIGARVRRPVRFVMHKFIFEIPVLATVFRLAKAIPIVSAKKDPEALAAAMDQVARELEEGRLVGIFPEGRLTPDGDMHEFKPGIERIIERTPVPVVPMALQGFWGSFFSNCGGAPMAHRPRLGFSRIGLRVGPAVAPEQVSAADLQRRVAELRGDQI